MCFDAKFILFVDMITSAQTLKPLRKPLSTGERLLPYHGRNLQVGAAFKLRIQL
jgi:hypothetical protein